MEMNVQSINKLGGMALVDVANDFYGCPDWINKEIWITTEKGTFQQAKAP